ncbi:MAG: TolC family protein [Lachnospiraceae bacterium]|nr:TolC family protein [Lachnospiraceae bacterium]
MGFRMEEAMKRLHETAKKCIACILAASLVLPSFPVQTYAAQAKKKMKLSTARSLAIKHSYEYEGAEDAVESKRAQYDSAVKALKLKKKNLRTFRWSPLLSFKFPQKLDFSQESEQQVKPMALLNDIAVAEHKVQDLVYKIGEEINNLYVEIVTLQENIAFNEERITNYTDSLDRTRARFKMGQATQSDIDRIQKKLDKLNNTVASDRRTFEADVQKLSKKIGVDLTTGYEFEKPYVEAKIDRESLEKLIQYAEDRDEKYYEACIAATTGLKELSINYDIMKGKYGSDMNLISSYVYQAMNGQEVSKKAFKAAYKNFLEKIDSYWAGKFRILFVKFSRLFLKGNLDGTRFIEDDPYVLFNNVMDYVSLHKDELSAKDDLDQSVTDAYNNYVSVRNSYTEYQKSVKEQQEKLKEYAVQNRMGYMTLDEYQDAVDDYESTQNEMLDAMKLYTTTLYSFDRLTCGGVSAMLSGTDADLQTAVLGVSYVEKEIADGASYYIKPIVQKEMFALSLHIPEGFEVQVTDFELWCDNVQIGPRTKVDGELRHLKLSKDNVDAAKIRLYNGENFVDDVVIDPDSESGPLNITTAMNIRKKETGEVGSYVTTLNDVTGFMSLKFTFLEEEGITSYRILAEDGTALKSSTPIEATKEFVYLPIMGADLEKLTVECYGDDAALKYACRLKTSAQSVVKKETEE